MTVVTYPKVEKLQEQATQGGTVIKEVKVSKDEKYISDLVIELGKHGIKLGGECGNDE